MSRLFVSAKSRRCCHVSTTLPHQQLHARQHYHTRRATTIETNYTTRLRCTHSCVPSPSSLPTLSPHTAPRFLHSSVVFRLHGRHSSSHGQEDKDDDNGNSHDNDDQPKSKQQSAPSGVVDSKLMEKECTEITMYGVYSNIGLAVFKFAGGIMGNSTAMVADGVHSLSDLVTDGITLWAARLTHKPQDADHPYGHGKFEAVGSLSISAALLATAGGIGWSAIESMQTVLANESLAVPTGVALLAAVVSIAVKEILYHATLAVGKRWNSKVVKANAWHHRSDSISTLVAMIGVGGAMIKMPLLDPLAGLFVSGLIAKAALELGWDSIRDLTDENVDADLLADVSAVLTDMKDEGVLSFHRLRGRAMGPFVLMDCHISVDPTISVSSAHQIAERVRVVVRQQIPIIAEFAVHVDVAQTHSVFETLGDDKAAAHKASSWAGEVDVFTGEHVAEIVSEFSASTERAKNVAKHKLAETVVAAKKAEKAKDADTNHKSTAKAEGDATSSSSKSADSSSDPDTKTPASSTATSTSASQSTSPTSPAAAVATTAATSPTGPKPLDLSTLMRPQASIERDVRRVLATPHNSYAQHIKGLSHFTVHWIDQKLRVQLELAFQTDISIRQATIVAKEIEADLKAQIKDIHAVDIHLELTEEHIANAKTVQTQTLELEPTASK